MSLCVLITTGAVSDRKGDLDFVAFLPSPSRLHIQELATDSRPCFQVASLVKRRQHAPPGVLEGEQRWSWLLVYHQKFKKWITTENFKFRSILLKHRLFFLKFQ